MNFYTQPTFTCSNLTIKFTGSMFEICTKLTIKTPEQRHSGVLIVNFGQISDCSGVSILVFEQANLGWGSNSLGAPRANIGLFSRPSLRVLTKTKTDCF